MNKHTPGPWEARTFAIFAKNEMVAHTGGTLGAGPKTMEQEANARLIAAAPEMLAALKQIAADWKSVGPRAQVPDEINVDAHWEAVWAAIAKAEGADVEPITLPVA